MRLKLALALFLGLPLVGLVVSSGAAGSAAGEPRYDSDNRLLRPVGYEEWIFVGASLGLSYSEHVRPGGSGSFHHVYLEPGAYDHFARTGSFPEKTMLVLEIYERAEKAAPSLSGSFEGERLAVEVALKDSERFAGGWAYFDFSDGKQASRAFERQQCASCHAEHAADDNVFTQFYPVLRRLKEGG